MFVAPGATASVTDLPDGSYRPEFAIGELWSRACHDFTAGMRAQRLPATASLAALSPLVIPPELSVPPRPVDIPDRHSNRNRDQPMAITLQESLRGLFYAPFYVALARDAYAAEGVEVRFVSSPRPGDAARNVMDGEVDVCWGGPMRVMQAYQQMPGCDLVSFAEVVTRDPFLLVGREPRPDFALRDLVGLRVATVSEVPTPWMCLQEDLRRAGIASVASDARGGPDDGGECRRAAPRRGGCGAGVRAVRRGVAGDGAGHVWYAQASRGPTSYTTFYARRGLLQQRRDELHRMVRAIYRTQKWVADADRCGDRRGDRAIFRRMCRRRYWRVPARDTSRWASGAAIRVCRAPATIGCVGEPGVGRLRLAGHGVSRWRWTTAWRMRWWRKIRRR